jgi:uncharacterized protein
MIVVHHNDFDGIGSAALIYQKFKKEHKFIFIEGDYRKKIDLDKSKYTDHSILYIVDYSLKDDETWTYAIQNYETIWIDHHETAINKWEKYNNISGFRDTKDSAILLTYEYLHPATKIPYAVKLLDDYDVWKWQYKEKTRYFQHGLKILDLNPENEIWERLFTDNDIELCENIIENGKKIDKYISLQNENIVKKNAYELSWENCLCICCNSNIKTSLLFDSLSENYDILISYDMDKNRRYNVSLYSKSPEIKVNEIASKFGGGGHPNAAGFSCISLPWF